MTTNLAGTGIGILCLTRENIEAPWILFEAGALSKGLDKSRVCPLLVNISYPDLKPPLSAFNGTSATKEEMQKLVETINRQNGEKAIPNDKVVKSFEKWWEEFNSKFSELLKSYKPTKEVHKRPAEDMIEEILGTTRAIQNALQFTFERPLSIGEERDNEIREYLMRHQMEAVAKKSQLYPETPSEVTPSMRKILGLTLGGPGIGA